ncbi:uncharacterized protein LOC129574069 isoform X1 [Sitodiplosis mosellana]|uniref:uncharacterized protein LOC129574069 isoform X1 n=1 Tax=Sitodiplosis mosellana TaxID=263140 RepID=UPI0024443232|nr:uncharacterized protein LOC129574069 isoform X1 [Sitodiplosis mosellana]
MARRKRHNKTFGRPRKNKVQMKKHSIVKKKPVNRKEDSTKQSTENGTIEISAIKLAFNSIINTNLTETERGFLIHKFFEKCLNATKVMHLASMLMLYRVNEAFDDDNLNFFVNQNGANVITDCFNCVTSDNIKDPLTAQMPDAFLAMVTQGSPNFEWPRRHQMTRQVYALKDQYVANVKTNLETHCWVRLTHFLRVKCHEFNHKGSPLEVIYNASYLPFDDIDIRNTMKNLMYNEDWTYDDDESRKGKMDILFKEVSELCGPSFVKCFTMYEYIQKDWFESLWMWIGIQRIMDKFLIDTAHLRQQWKAYDRDPVNNREPSVPKIPKVKNFAAIPLCDTKLKHIPFDHNDLIDIIGQLRNERGWDIRADYRTYYKQGENKDEAWGIVFDMDKIRQLRTGSKEFYHKIQTNSSAVSVLFSRPKRKGAGVTLSEIKAKYEKPVSKGGYKYESGIDPGQKTKMACVRRTLATGIETNIKLSSIQYHWGARQGMRDKQATKMTRKYVHKEQRDLKSYPITSVSPRGSQWKSFIKHKIKMLTDSLATYARRKYAQLSLHKYIESNREMDLMAKHITKNETGVVFLGDAAFPSNSKIGVKRTKRTPDQRKFIVSLKKDGKTDVVPTPEPYTSQTCANCLRRFPRSTKSDRFKVCKDCRPHKDVRLPPVIVTDRSRRRKQRDRKQNASQKPTANVTRAERAEKHRENRRSERESHNPEQLDTEQAVRRYNRRIRRRELRQRRRVAGHRSRKVTKQPEAESDLPGFDKIGDTSICKIRAKNRKAKPQLWQRIHYDATDKGIGLLGSKKIAFQKNWHSSPMNDRNAFTVTWHRDICAKCILYRGRCMVFDLNVHESFVLPPERIWPKCRDDQSRWPIKCCR